MQVCFDPNSIDDYKLFLKVKQLPSFKITGRVATFPDEYASRLALEPVAAVDVPYEPRPFLFDYQRDIATTATIKRKFCLFIECGLGKTNIFLEFARQARDTMPKQKGTLIVSPLMVTSQTLDESIRWYTDELGIEPIPSGELQYWLDRDDQRIGITNYEAFNHDVTRGNLGALVIDECFPPDTLIDTIDPLDLSFRQSYIEDIRPGDTIPNASGVDYVKHIWKRRVHGAVRVRTEWIDVTCSENHPFFTLHGWKSACDLRPGDYIMETKEAMCLVRNGVSPEEHGAKARKVLREVLLSEMADEPPGAQSEGPQSYCCRKAGQGKSGMVQGGVSGGTEREAKAGGIAADERSSNQKEGIRYTESNGTQAASTGRQRDGCNRTTGTATRLTEGQVDNGVPGCCWARENERIPNELQGRYCECPPQDCYRGRRAIASSDSEEVAGQKEGRYAGFARVDSVEVLELGHSDLDCYRDEAGDVYFYDIEATRHPSFSVGGLLVHNSSMLKSHYGKWGQKILGLGKGLDWKMSSTGTPAPNDRIEYANQAVFMDAFPTVNSFLAKFFVNRGQTNERWILKPHALEPFYRALSHWSIFLTNPATYGWKDNSETIPPIHINQHDVPLTEEQTRLAYQQTGDLFANRLGGITSRSVLSQIAKGSYRGKRIETHKPGYIADLIGGWPGESTLVWCKFNAEQKRLEEAMPEAGSIDGQTPIAKRQEIVDTFKAGELKTLISKPKILGFGLNLQVATRQVFSACDDSYEQFYQAVKRSNRVGSTRPLNVHLPMTDIERPLMENVLRKARMVQADTDEQERIFRKAMA